MVYSGYCSRQFMVYLGSSSRCLLSIFRLHMIPVYMTLYGIDMVKSCIWLILIILICEDYIIIRFQLVYFKSCDSFSILRNEALNWVQLWIPIFVLHCIVCSKYLHGVNLSDCIYKGSHYVLDGKPKWPSVIASGYL